MEGSSSEPVGIPANAKGRQRTRRGGENTNLFSHMSVEGKS